MTRSVTVLLALLVLPSLARAQVPVITWAQHDTLRPLPPVVRPAPVTAPTLPPSDAIALFAGADAASWRSADDRAAGWRVADGALEVVPGAGDIHTQRGFGDCQLHIEWATPAPPQGRDQERGNSGVFLMSLYEVQVLDSYENRTYADGMAAAVFGEYPPLVNASRPPGEWQSYDIVFTRPRFDPSGVLREPAYLTVFHNGVLAQDHVALVGPTTHMRRAPYLTHPSRLPLRLQDHGVRVRFRNIWIRELPESP